MPVAGSFDLRSVFLASCFITVVFSGCLAAENDGPPSGTEAGPAGATDRFAWSGNITGPAALRLTFLIEDETECELEVGLATGPQQGGPVFFSYLLGPDGDLEGAFGASVTGTTVHVMDQKVVDGGLSGSDVGVTFMGTFEPGAHSLVFAAQNVAAGDDGDESVSVSFVCQHAVLARVDAAGSREAILIGSITPGGGAVVALPVAPKIGVTNARGAEFTSAEVEAFVVILRAAGSGEVWSPDGSEPFTLAGGTFTKRLTGGPGAWGARFDAVVDAGVTIIALLGLTPLPGVEAIEDA